MIQTAESAKKNEGKEVQKPSSSCLFNIIFYIENESAKNNYQAFLDSLKKKFPCRAIFIVEKADSTQDSLKIEINGNDCQKAKNACDQISIECTEKSKDKVFFLILSYLLADLPIYVIWSQDLVKSHPILEDLKNIATKIVFDPELSNDLKEFSAHVIDHIEHKKCSVTDFAWFNCFGWRELFSSVFDSKERIDQLFHARIIRIKYKSLDPLQNKNDSAAIYFQAWLAAHMNWKVHDVESIEGNKRISYERFLHDTIVLLIPEKGDESNFGQITSVEIDGPNAVHYLFQQSAKEPFVRIWISDASSCEIPFQVTLSTPSKEQLVIGDLFRRSTALHYHNMLKLLYQTKWID
jgi:glucose-6-phosphate dehydrogenase assembly protein OpcA